MGIEARFCQTLGNDEIFFRVDWPTRYQRSEKALVGTLAEMYVQGVSTRKVKAVTETLCGHSFSASAVSSVNKSLDQTLQAFAERRLSEPFPYLILDARYEKVREAGIIVSQAVLTAVAAGALGGTILPPIGTGLRHDGVGETHSKRRRNIVRRRSRRMHPADRGVLVPMMKGRLCPVPSIIERSPACCVRLRDRVSSPVPERKYCISRSALKAAPTISIAGQDRRPQRLV